MASFDTYQFPTRGGNYQLVSAYNTAWCLSPAGEAMAPDGTYSHGSGGRNDVVQTKLPASP